MNITYESPKRPLNTSNNFVVEQVQNNWDAHDIHNDLDKLDDLNDHSNNCNYNYHNDNNEFGREQVQLEKGVDEKIRTNDEKNDEKNGEKNDEKNDNVDMQIIQERNEEIKHIEHEVGLLADLYHTVQNLVWDQGIGLNDACEKIQNSEIEITEGVKHLENAEKYQVKSNKVRDASIVMSGALLGSVGWIGGPWIGIPTTGLGVGISSGVVFILRKIGI